jgi:hypothetical protein
VNAVENANGLSFFVGKKNFSGNLIATKYSYFSRFESLKNKALINVVVDDDDDDDSVDVVVI